ncbi:S8 family serine peptidase [bacterium]|jgi:subtilisin family serine protease|nr:S8 family serine peptidase [bacterium]
MRKSVFLYLIFLSTLLCSREFLAIRSRKDHDPKIIEITLTNLPSKGDTNGMGVIKKHDKMVRKSLPKYIQDRSIGKMVNGFTNKIKHFLSIKKINLSDFKIYRSGGHYPGHYSFYTPDGVDSATLIKEIGKWLKENKISASVSEAAAVYIGGESVIGLEGKSLNGKELSLLPTSLIPKYEYMLKGLRKEASAAKGKKKDEIENKAAALAQRIETLKKVKAILFWHQEVPTTGLRVSDKFSFNYEFLPHMLPLWVLAPKKGAGVRVVDIDTGIAAFNMKGNAKYLENPDLGITSPQLNPLYDNCNLVGKRGTDDIEQCVYTVENYVGESKFNYGELEKYVPIWIRSYLANKDVRSMTAYLKAKGKDGLFDSSGKITEKGKQAIDDITTGPEGFAPKGGDSKFDLVELENGQKVILQMLPTAEILQTQETFVSGHGSHTSGLIAGKLQGSSNVETPADDTGICGIAPEVDFVMVKAFPANGSSDTPTLIAAVKKAIQYGADVVNFSLKIDDKKPTNDLLKDFFSLIPYPVVASGNDGSPKLSHNYPGVVESYPGKFVSIPFDVGSFSYKIDKIGTVGEFPISIFSQYEPGIGPKFVSPGFNILSSALVPGQKDPATYVVMDGTSMATPIMTGFVALMLSEFKNDFDKEEMLTTCYRSAVRYHDNDEWNTKTLLGALDMRTALLTLHVIRNLRAVLAKKKIDIKFNNLLEAANTIFFGMVDEYSHINLTGQSFKKNLAEFLNVANKNRKLFNRKKLEEKIGGNTLDAAVTYVSNIVLYAYKPSLVKTKPNISDTILAKVKKVLKIDNLDIFRDFPEKTKNRLLKTEKINEYWEEQAKLLKQHQATKSLARKVGKKSKDKIVSEFKQIEEFRNTQVRAE